MTFVARAHLAVPAALTAYLGFHAGGFFPDSVGLSALVVLLLVLLRLTLAGLPWAGWSRTAAIAAGAGALFAAWTLVSAQWSGSAGRSLLEFDRVLLYLAGFVLLALAPRRPGDLSLALRLVLAVIVVIACAGLATRLYPTQLGHFPPRDAARLAWPLTYWNALGVCCALGTVLALHAASGRREPAFVRILATAAMPITVVAGYFTFSRGAIGAAAVGLVLYVVLVHSRRLAFSLVTGGVAAAVALKVAYASGALASPTYMTGDGPAEGRHVALVVVLACVLGALARAALLPLEARADRVAISPVTRRRLLLAAATAAGVVLVTVAVAIDAPARLHAEVRGFTEGNYVAHTSDLRARLDDPGNNGRLAIWRVDLRAFHAEPLRGIGAGMYRSEWERFRPFDQHVVDGHSLYLEVLGELGIVGVALLGAWLLAAGVGVARGLRGPEGHARAALLAVGVALLLHAGIDWDWEMPALFGWVIALAGLACARGRPAPGLRPPGRYTRVLAGLAVLLLAVTPALLWRSQVALVHADQAFGRGDCTTAIDSALTSAGLVSVRPEPYEILGYCDLRSGADALAVRAMEKARARDPRNWRYAYGVAVARALAGQDPRAAIAAAHRLNPLDPLARQLVRGFRGDDPARWWRAASRALIPGA